MTEAPSGTGDEYICKSNTVAFRAACSRINKLITPGGRPYGLVAGDRYSAADHGFESQPAPHGSRTRSRSPTMTAMLGGDGIRGKRGTEGRSRGRGYLGGRRQGGPTTTGPGQEKGWWDSTAAASAAAEPLP